MERDFSQWLQVRGQGWSNTGTGCPEGLQCLGAGQTRVAAACCCSLTLF